MSGAPDPARFRRVKELVQQALALPQSERAAFLAGACDGDEALLAEVQALLAGGGSVDFLEPPVAAPVPVPRILGDFELLEELAHQGAMGVVYRARQVSLQREVAVKILPHASALAQRHVERFRREALAVAKLSHPNIVPIHYVGFDHGLHYFAMDFVHGHGLNAELDAQRTVRDGGTAECFLPPFGTPEYLRACVRLVAAVADALHHSHRHGVVHRDVKPHNVLLDRDGQPHVVDFGLAKVEELGSLSRTGDIAGTPYYMSPEQALAKRVQIDHRTDIYSLGVVLYELLTLVRPFEGRSSQEVLYAISFREPRRLRRVNPRVPRDLETICETAMCKLPDGRFRDARELAEDLRRFLDHEAIVHARRPGPWTRLSRHVHRRMNWYLPSGAAVVTLVPALAGLSSWRHRRELDEALGPLREVVEAADVEEWPAEELRDRLARARALRERGIPAADERAWVGPSVERIEAVGRRRRELGLSHVQRGLPSPAGTPLLEYRHGSDTDFFRGLALLGEARLLLPLDAEIEHWLDLRNTFPRVELVADSALAGARVYRQSIDWLSREIGPPELLGELPLAGPRPVEPGVHRITVVREPRDAPAEVLAEFTRILEGRARVTRLEVRAALGRPATEMVLVPAGEYLVGDPHSQRIPQFLARRVRLPAFWIDATEVTNADYRAFVDATRHAPPPGWQSGYRSEWDDLPVMGVTFADAQAYAEWVGKRLPTQYEWEAAARGPKGFAYPWGNDEEDVATRAVVDRPIDVDTWAGYLAHVRPVGTTSGDVSPFGCRDMLGNVREWTETIAPTSTETGEPYPDQGSRLMKGLSWQVDPHAPRPNLIDNYGCPVVARDRSGFRCARSAWPR